MTEHNYKGDNIKILNGIAIHIEVYDKGEGHYYSGICMHAYNAKLIVN